MHPDLVALLGDEQYQVGKLSDFMALLRQDLRRHEVPGASGARQPRVLRLHQARRQRGRPERCRLLRVFQRSGPTGAIRPQGQAGDYNQGWYSYNLGNWHIISLNIECSSPAFGNNCDPTTGVLGQETAWLAKDLAANRSACTLAYWHQPTFSATGSAGNPPYTAFGSTEGGAADTWWKLLYAHGADVVLNGHEHVYARFQPMNPSGQVDTRKGITQFTVGTGGEDLDTLSASPALTAEHVVTAEDSAYGVLKLTLGQHGYGYSFKPVAAGNGQDPSVLSYSDSGTGSCHGPAHHDG